MFVWVKNVNLTKDFSQAKGKFDHIKYKSAILINLTMFGTKSSIKIQ